MFYDEALLGGGTNKPTVPLTIKTDLLSPSRASLVSAVPTVASPVADAKAPSAAVHKDGGGDEGVEGDEGADEGALDDVNWSDDEALDALVDKFVGEVDGKWERHG